MQALVATPLAQRQGAPDGAAVARSRSRCADMRAEARTGAGCGDAWSGPATARSRRAARCAKNDLIGGLVVVRKTPGAYAAEIVELLQTFATQSALAIQNARLFHELEDKSRQLEAASRHKSEFLANMSPRAAHAAQRDHRVLRGADRAHVRGAEREAGRST